MNIHITTWWSTLFLVSSARNPATSGSRPFSSFWSSSRSRFSKSCFFFFYHFILKTKWFPRSNFSASSIVEKSPNSLVSRHALKMKKHHKHRSKTDNSFENFSKSHGTRNLRNLLILISLSIVPFYSSLSGEFVFDDAESVVSNPIVNEKDPLSQVPESVPFPFSTIFPDILPWLLGSTDQFSTQPQKLPASDNLHVLVSTDFKFNDRVGVKGSSLTVVRCAIRSFCTDTPATLFSFQAGIIRGILPILFLLHLFHQIFIISALARLCFHFPLLFASFHHSSRFPVLVYGPSGRRHMWSIT